MPVHRAAQSAEELALLRTVVADLSDTVALSVYNDWLEEQGDPRGPFLRRFIRAFVSGERLPTITQKIAPVWARLLALPMRRRLRHGPYRRYNASLEPRFDDILRSAIPALRMQGGELRSLKHFPPGATRIGGLPDLPAGAAWPMGPNDSDPRIFLLQIDLADLRGTIVEGLLPDEGLLLFFLPEDRNQGVEYVPPGTPLARVPFPGGDNAGWAVQPSRLAVLSDALRYEKEIEALPIYLPSFTADDEAELSHWLCTRCRPGYTWHWEVMEGVPETELLELAYIDDESELGWGFSDGDPLYVLMPLADARGGRFDRVRMHDAT